MKIPAHHLSSSAYTRGYIEEDMSRCKASLKVVAYNLDGTLFAIYDSAREASAKLGGYPRTVDKCIRGDTLTAFGYIWRRYEENDIPKRIEPFTKPTINTKDIPIAEIDNDGKIIKIYPSIKQASKENKIDTHSIRDNLKGKSKQTRGKRFKYLDSIK